MFLGWCSSVLDDHYLEWGDQCGCGIDDSRDMDPLTDQLTGSSWPPSLCVHLDSSTFSILHTCCCMWHCCTFQIYSVVRSKSIGVCPWCPHWSHEACAETSSTCWWQVVLHVVMPRVWHLQCKASSLLVTCSEKNSVGGVQSHLNFLKIEGGSVCHPQNFFKTLQRVAPCRFWIIDP